jgi:hypothetical protein
MGAALPQSLAERHSTHLPSFTMQRGAPAGQSALTAHSTHCRVTGSQILASAGQSIAERQPTQSPVDGWQIGAPWGQVVLEVQAAWHRWSDDQQAGVDPEQLAFEPQVTHEPSRQTGAAAGQLPLVTHATQPRTESQSWPEWHWLAPQRTVPPTDPVELPPPHARKIDTRAAGHARDVERTFMRLVAFNIRAEGPEAAEARKKRHDLTGGPPGGGRASDHLQAPADQERGLRRTRRDSDRARE